MPWRPWSSGPSVCEACGLIFPWSSNTAHIPHISHILKKLILMSSHFRSEGCTCTLFTAKTNPNLNTLFQNTLTPILRYVTNETIVLSYCFIVWKCCSDAAGLLEISLYIYFYKHYYILIIIFVLVYVTTTTTHNKKNNTNNSSSVVILVVDLSKEIQIAMWDYIWILSSHC